MKKFIFGAVLGCIGTITAELLGVWLLIVKGEK